MLRLTYRTLSTAGGSIIFRSIVVDRLVSIERHITDFAEISADLAFIKHVFLSVNLEEELWLVPSGIQVNVKIICIISHSEAMGTTPVKEETGINSKVFLQAAHSPIGAMLCWCRWDVKAAVFTRSGFDLSVPAVLSWRRAKESFYTSLDVTLNALQARDEHANAAC